MQIDITEVEARRITQALQDRIDLYNIALHLAPSPAGIKRDITLLKSLIKKINHQINKA